MWLHTHALDGIIHIEAPKLQTFTLGQFFAVWGVKLSKARLGGHVGKVTAFYNGKVWTGSPSEDPAHERGPDPARPRQAADRAAAHQVPARDQTKYHQQPSAT